MILACNFPMCGWINDLLNVLCWQDLDVLTDAEAATDSDVSSLSKVSNALNAFHLIF